MESTVKRIGMIAAFALAMATAAIAADIKPLLWTAKPDPSAGMIASVSSVGEVRIDWQAAADCVASPTCERTTLAIARILFAVRDGTYKPLK
jgi:hypothetical protein